MVRLRSCELSARAACAVDGEQLVGRREGTLAAAPLPRVPAGPARARRHSRLQRRTNRIQTLEQYYIPVQFTPIRNQHNE